MARERGFLRNTARLVGPMVLAILMVLVLRLPFYVDGPGMLIADVGLIFVYYFTLNRPTVAPLGVVLILGVLVDAIDGGPIGASALIYVLVSTLLHNQRRFFNNRAFSISWIGFAILAVGAKALQWLMLSILSSDFLNVWPLMVETTVTILMFPLLGWVFGRYDRAWLR